MNNTRNPLTRLLAALTQAKLATLGAQRDLVLRASQQARVLRFADCATTLSLVDGLPTDLADRIEQALSDLGVDLT